MVDKVTSEVKIVDTDGRTWASWRPLTPQEAGFRPNWSKAPKWAKYWGMNPDGRAWWMSACPLRPADDGRWFYLATLRMKYDDSFMEGYWRDSIQQPPTRR